MVSPAWWLRYGDGTYSTIGDVLRGVGFGVVRLVGVGVGVVLGGGLFGFWFSVVVPVVDGPLDDVAPLLFSSLFLVVLIYVLYLGNFVAFGEDIHLRALWGDRG